jgi:hypothetical protein
VRYDSYVGPVESRKRNFCCRHTMARLLTIDSSITTQLHCYFERSIQSSHYQQHLDTEAPGNAETTTVQRLTECGGECRLLRVAAVCNNCDESACLRLTVNSDSIRTYLYGVCRRSFSRTIDEVDEACVDSVLRSRRTKKASEKCLRMDYPRCLSIWLVFLPRWIRVVNFFDGRLCQSRTIGSMRRWLKFVICHCHFFMLIDTPKDPAL